MRHAKRTYREIRGRGGAILPGLPTVGFMLFDGFLILFDLLRLFGA